MDRWLNSYVPLKTPAQNVKKIGYWKNLLIYQTWSKVLFFALTDIGVNLTDAMYQGEYHGSKKHEPDLDAVLERAWKHGLDKMMITGGSLEDAHKSLEIARSHGIIY